jgi:transposase InsO family protein
MIKENRDQYTIKMMCRMISVSASGYYSWLGRPQSSRAQDNAVLAARIKAIFDDEHSRAGAKRITKRLKAEGTSVSRNRVARIMRLHGWRAKAARKFKATTNSNHKLPVAPNLLQQNFAASRPNEKWVSDIISEWVTKWLQAAAC